MYAFNFKLKIVKSKNGGTRVRQLYVSDTLLHELFPDYKKLYDIDFSSLLKQRHAVNLVIPILVYNVSPTGQSEYHRQDGQPLVSINAAMEISERSLEALVPEKPFEEVVLLEPVVIKIMNLIN